MERCIECRSPFEPIRQSHVLCSDECRDSYYARKRIADYQPPHVPLMHCEHCARMYQPGKRGTMFCETCRRKGTAQRTRERIGRCCSRSGCTNRARAQVGPAVCDQCYSGKRKLEKDEYRAVRRLSRYGLSQAQYDRIWMSQGHGCGICGGIDPGHQYGWMIDHCHASNMVRGVLCHHCNAGIGLLKDDPKIMVAAAKYVERHTQIRLEL